MKNSFLRVHFSLGDLKVLFKGQYHYPVSIGRETEAWRSDIKSIVTQQIRRGARNRALDYQSSVLLKSPHVAVHLLDFSLLKPRFPEDG